MKRQRRQRQPPKPPELTPGSTVWLAGLKQNVQLLTTPDEEGRVEVQLGSFKLRVEAGRVRQAIKGTTKKPPTVGELRLLSYSVPPLELNLRGQRVDGLSEEVDRYLNDAFLSGLAQVRILHGKGSGTLRKVVREQLADHPLVKSFASAEPHDGGDGVTVAELAT